MADVAAQPAFAFLIGPGGEAGRALAAVIETALGSLYTLRPWYDEPSPGTVTLTVVERLRDAEVVLADLRGADPNVCYEVGIAHAFGTPVVGFVAAGEEPHFDLQGERWLPVTTEGDKIVQRTQLTQRIKEAVDSAVTEGPVTAVAFAELRAAAGGPGRELPTQDSLWRDLALTGRLPELGPGGVRAGALVVHLELGVGRVVGHSALDGPEVSVTVDFGKRRHAFVLPDPSLFVADVRRVRS